MMNFPRPQDKGPLFSDGGGQGGGTTVDEEVEGYNYIQGRAMELLGATPEEIGQMPISELFPQLEALAPDDDALRRIMEQQRYSLGAKGVPALAPDLRFIPYRETQRWEDHKHQRDLATEFERRGLHLDRRQSQDILFRPDRGN